MKLPFIDQPRDGAPTDQDVSVSVIIDSRVALVIEIGTLVRAAADTDDGAGLVRQKKSPARCRPLGRPWEAQYPRLRAVRLARAVPVVPLAAQLADCAGGAFGAGAGTSTVPGTGVDPAG